MPPQALGPLSAVSGGVNNSASAQATAVVGGISNAATALNASVGGGMWGTASGNSAVIGGGQNNSASAPYSAVGGGSRNQADREATASPAPSHPGIKGSVYQDPFYLFMFPTSALLHFSFGHFCSFPSSPRPSLRVFPHAMSHICPFPLHACRL